MTVSSEVKRKDYAGNGSTTNFATVFRFLENSDVKVILTVDSTGVETVQVLGTDYTLVGAGLDAGGTVTMTIAPAIGETLTVKRDVPLTQGTDYIENDEFPADSHEDALDKLTMITQQIQEEVDRSVKLSESSQVSDVTIPDPVNDSLLRWDQSGNLINVTVQQLGVIVDAGDLPYNQGGTGAVTSNVEKKLQEVISVKDFGAVGDGIINDTALLQSAANAAAGKTLFINEGFTFLVSGRGVLISDDTIVTGRGIVRNLDTGLDTTCFRVDRTSSNIWFDKLRLQGPFHAGGTVVFSDWNTGIITYGAYFRDVDPATGVARGTPLADAPSSNNIRITGCDMDGFASSGAQIDSIKDGIFNDNKITHCGRDGIRAFGIQDSQFVNNRVDDLAPGFDGVAPNLNVYGITLTRRFNTPESEYPRSERCVVDGNIITRAHSWKSLDTHGGKDITFCNNICLDSHIGVGIAEGSNGGAITTENTLVKGNIILARTNPVSPPRNAIAVFADATQIGVNNVLEGNYIEGYGPDLQEGAIAISEQRFCQVVGNSINNSLRAAINIQGDSSVSITGNYIRDVATSTVAVNKGIGVEDASAQAFISGNTFHKVTGSLDAIVVTTPSAGQGADVASDNRFIDVTSEVNSPQLLNGGSYLLQTFGFANINNSGTASISFSEGIISSVNRVSVGLVTVTFSKTFSATNTIFPSASPKSSAHVRFGFSNFTTTTVDVTTRNTSGTLIDTGFLFEIKGV